MKVLVDNSAYNLDNIGDIAMLQVAVRRMHAMIRDAEIHVVTANPELCTAYCPEAIPLALLNDDSCEGRDPLLFAKRILRKMRAASPFVDECWSRCTRNIPRKLLDKAVVDNALSHYDGVVVCGGGVFTDQYFVHAMGLLNTLAKAMDLGMPAFIFGNGFGPISNTLLIERCKRVLPRVSRINIREPNESLRLLLDVGVSKDAISCTGDDALELAHGANGDDPVCGIGLNVRYQALPVIRKDRLLAIRRCVIDFCEMHSAQVLPIPISINEEHPDTRTMRCILDGLQYLAEEAVEPCRYPSEAIRRIAKCRIVITGSYHAAVFGLAQGKPAICLSNTPYYDGKFEGLRHLFVQGVEIVDIASSSFERLLRQAMKKAWEVSDLVKADLLAKTQEQIARSRDAYCLLGAAMRQREDVNQGSTP